MFKYYVLIVILGAFTYHNSLAQTKPVAKPATTTHAVTKPLPKKPATKPIKADTTPVVPKGVITIVEEDTGIAYIMGNFPMPAESKHTVSGYRIQVLATTSRQLANDTKAKVMEKFPDLHASVVYQQPYFKLRIGDFEDYVAAQSEFKKVHKQFPTSFIVPDMVTVYH